MQANVRIVNGITSSTEYDLVSVVDCPSLDYVDSLVNNSTFARHQATATSHADVAYLVVHFTPQAVMEDSR